MTKPIGNMFAGKGKAALEVALETIISLISATNEDGLSQKQIDALMMVHDMAGKWEEVRKQFEI